MSFRRAHKLTDAAQASEAALPPALPSFEQLVASPEQQRCFEARAETLAAEGQVRPSELELGCVVELDRGFPVVCCASRTARCEYAQSLSSLKTAERAAVGDWVCVRWPEGHERGFLLEVMPRRSDIARWRGSSRGEKQTLAANVDTVFAVQAFDKRGCCSADYLARLCVVALDCGSAAAAVVTKADLCPSASELAEALASLRHVLGAEIPIVCTSAPQKQALGVPEQGAWEEACAAADAQWGSDTIRALLAPGQTGMLIGQSGVGKSTLINTLVGEDVVPVGRVRARDGAGRQTTVSRRMVALPGAGVLVDEPGLRTIPLLGHERGLALLFGDVAEHASACRFANCTHTTEPGCAVRAACDAGAFPVERLDIYVELAREMRESNSALDPDVVI